MNYIYPPLYKYIAFILIFFLFLGHYKVITQQNYLLVSLMATVIIILLDYFLIENHTGFINNNINNNIDPEDALHNLIETESEDYMYEESNHY